MICDNLTQPLAINPTCDVHIHCAPTHTHSHTHTQSFSSLISSHLSPALPLSLPKNTHMQTELSLSQKHKGTHSISDGLPLSCSFFTSQFPPRLTLCCASVISRL